MGLETGTYISDLNASNPVGASDPKSQGDDHIRLIKSTLLATFPNLTGAMTKTQSELNAVAVTSAANSFTATQKISNSTPVLGLNESDQAVDNRLWYLRSTGGQLRLEAVNDAESSSNIAISIDRSGASITGVNIVADTRIKTGGDLYIYDPGDTDYGRFYHNGADFYQSFTNTANLNILGLTASVGIYGGVSVRVYDSGGTLYISNVHDGTRGYLATSSGGLYIQPATAISDFYKNGTNSTVRVWDSSGVDWVSMSNDGTNAIIDTGGSSGGLLLKYAANTEIQLQLHSNAGNTSGAKVKDSGGSLRDIGFNILPEFNTNVSDTIESQHCGSLSIKDNTTAYTLTLEASGAGDFPVGAVTQIANGGTSADYTITEGASTTLYYLEPGVGLTDTAGGCTLGPGGIATIWRRSATVYWIWGSEITP